MDEIITFAKSELMRTCDSKIATFFLFIILFTATSCNGKYNDVIPDVYVDFFIDLVYDPLFYDLTAAGNSVVITSSTNNWGTRSAGYDGNGIIVYYSGDDYYAYDRTCPYCYKLGGQSVAVEIDGIYAVCPECGTNYALPSYGTPTSGPGEYMLKNYHTKMSGYSVHVWNRQ
jgi:hypothetical protein